MPRQYYNEDLKEFDCEDSESDRIREHYHREAERKEQLRELDKEEGEKS